MTVIGSYQVWPEGLTWVFQGTVAEDATAGTHVCSLTVTPGTGNEMIVQAYRITVGNTATAQTVLARVDDGTNILYDMLNPVGASDTVANERYQGPASAAAIASVKDAIAPSWTMMVSGTMRLILQVTTAAVSVTQTFALVCRIKGSAPTAVLLDTIGTSTNTINTNKVFG